MFLLQISFGLVVALDVLLLVHGQGVSPATVDNASVEATQGKEAKLSCSTSEGLRFCVWERLSKDDTNRSPFIVNFNEITSQPGVYSGMSGYSYTGDGFEVGQCGVKISAVKREDFAKWQCTLITADKVYRGNVELEKFEPPKENAPSSLQADDTGDNSENRPRPIITSYNDARAIIQPELVVHSASDGSGTQLIQEVKVESAGLQIKPKRAGKLIVFE